ncbi:glycoside hydrolase family 16 protein [Mycena floridula]|nr:glycoside hydrolase family 16 protein [Mycena floridula]
MFYSVAHSITILSFALLARSATYSRTANIVGAGFNDAFFYDAIPDPTSGRVNYVDAVTARSQNLTYASSNTFIARSDFKNVLSPAGLGRNSFRLKSNKQYSTSVTIFNVRHMPTGCGTWPALWSFGDEWPNQGEIDILEGVNDQGPNQSTLHTSDGCVMPASREETGTPILNDCNVAVNGNSGCGVHADSAASYGPSFNAAGGGWYAMERTNTDIRVWFWSRASSNVPADVLAGGTSVSTEAWGTPTAYFPSTSCDIASHFGVHNIIINLTFCGDWAGQAGIYAQSGCPSTCNDFVDNNPAAFSEAFFDFESLNIYE